MKDCKLVEDLLPLYLEDMLGEPSRQFVEEHLSQCAGCQQLYDKLSADAKNLAKAPDAEQLTWTEKEKSIKQVVRGYRKWLFSIISIAIICSLLGGIAGTYLIMKYEELVPNHIAQDFVKYGLKGDRWVYQERLSQALKGQLPFDKYIELRTWEDVERYSSKLNPAGFKVYKNVNAQEFGPFEVSLNVGLVLEQGGFRVFKVVINDKAEYLKKKEALEKAVEEKNQTGNQEQVAEIDKQYVHVPPTDPTRGEYFVEGRILKINGNKIAIEQHMDTHSVPTDGFVVTPDTVLARHEIVKDTDYYRKITMQDLKVGDIVFVIMSKDNTPKVVSIN